MTRPCESCGMMSCNGVECYFDEPEQAELDPGEIPFDQWKINHPEEVARIRKWRIEGDAERADLEPRKRPDGRWSVAA